MQDGFGGKEGPGTTDPVTCQRRPWVVIRSHLVFLEGEGGGLEGGCSTWEPWGGPGG